MTDINPTIMSLASRMQYKLTKNEHKDCDVMNPDGRGRGWKHCDPNWLIMRIRQETDELEAELTEGKWEEMLDECADIANFAMMVHDIIQERVVRFDHAIEQLLPANLPQHAAQGIQRHQNTDYAAITDRIAIRLNALEDRLDDLTKDELIAFDHALCMCERITKLFTGRKQPPDGPKAYTATKPGPEPIMAPHGQSETFQSLCEKGKNPIPLKQPMGGVAITNWIDGLTLSQLCSAADRYDIPHNESEWIDDDYPDKTDELRVAVAEALEKVGK